MHAHLQEYCAVPTYSWPVLCDPDMKLGKALGVCFHERFGDAEARWYPQRGDPVGGNTYGPALFVLDTDGTVLYQWFHDDHKVRLSGETILAIVKSVQDPAARVPVDMDTFLARPDGTRRLNLGYQELTQVPEGIRSLTDLEELSLNNNAITELPAWIGDLQNLRKLDVSSNRLASLPPELGRLVRLEDLQCLGNKLTVLPPQIGALVALKRLNLMYNPLESLPPELGNCSRLEYLRLCGHRIRQLPPETGDLGALRQLFVPGTRTVSGEILGLETLPPQIGQLRNLVELHLQHNRLKTLPPEVGQMTALKLLYVADNRLERVPPELGDLQNLGGIVSEGLWFSRNRLKELPAELGAIVPLVGLHASGNLLTTVPDRILKAVSWGGVDVRGNPVPLQEQERMKTLWLQLGKREASLKF